MNIVGLKHSNLKLEVAGLCENLYLFIYKITAFVTVQNLCNVYLWKQL